MGMKLFKFAKDNSDIDLILMDMKIPVMDGFDATKEIRLFNKDVVIIAQTAYELVGDREKAIEAGCDDYVSKPIVKNMLFN
jgi:CheY-like chemotaxis protein